MKKFLRGLAGVACVYCVSVSACKKGFQAVAEMPEGEGKTDVYSFPADRSKFNLRSHEIPSELHDAPDGAILIVGTDVHLGKFTEDFRLYIPNGRGRPYRVHRIEVAADGTRTETHYEAPEPKVAARMMQERWLDVHAGALMEETLKRFGVNEEARAQANSRLRQVRFEPSLKPRSWEELGVALAIVRSSVGVQSARVFSRDARKITKDDIRKMVLGEAELDVTTDLDNSAQTNFDDVLRSLKLIRSYPEMKREAEAATAAILEVLVK